MYLGIAAACEGNIQEFPTGERHAFNLFLAQEVGSDPDLALAEDAVKNEFWSDIELTKTGIFNSKAVDNSEPPFPGLYKQALANGSALLIYLDPVP
ncbi:hypothetical protein [Alcanivorax sp.]|uniref:hypothetical protein n=1 Tax=Alcanivorax sp. TaxID=1872427 RepID=UPI000C39E777|nr:hypothetical protein [Alcanivorax sp.]MBQ25081.1 hypothetical protein [Alcanivorax sp.]|tara:strand:+ start:1298 stop:1585 length:288 start_codon:yes stop_codon:yes gene_type:complete